jgi:hypothetical protein
VILRVQSSVAHIAGCPPEHSRPAQHCSVDVQVSPSSAHSAALAFGIRRMPNWRSSSDIWRPNGARVAAAAGSINVSSPAHTDAEKTTQITAAAATNGIAQVKVL